MAERPPIRTRGCVTLVHEKNRLYEVEMENGYRAYAVLERKGPAPSNEDPTGKEVVVDFTPYDMSRCKIVEWAE